MKLKIPIVFVVGLTALVTAFSILMLVGVTATVPPNRDEGEDWIDALSNAVMVYRRSGGGISAHGTSPMWSNSRWCGLTSVAEMRPPRMRR